MNMTDAKQLYERKAELEHEKQGLETMMQISFTLAQDAQPASTDTQNVSQEHTNGATKQ
jgi:hypothetical protein